MQDVHADLATEADALADLIRDHEGRVMLPAAVIDRVDADEEKVYVSRTKDEIKNAPELDDPDDPDYRHALGAHYNRNP